MISQSKIFAGGNVLAKVTFQTSDHELRKEQKPITFRATNGNGQIGRLVVSKGGLRWYPGKSTKNHHFLSWEALDKKLPDIAKQSS
ncbi:hypothetical protein [Bradyrhizobium aeschynomenes]|uniref:hypothetical protein n=1 Tax=Bradyrhizobium aeschynomenes TaxID=2734909 RepID=UPI0015551452|nr:hypothetical protein [Bradyrhizobium aeschynomenes]